MIISVLEFLTSIATTLLPVSRSLKVMIIVFSTMIFGPRDDCELPETIHPSDYIHSYVEITVPLNNILREQETLSEQEPPHKVDTFPKSVTPYTYKQ